MSPTLTEVADTSRGNVRISGSEMTFAGFDRCITSPGEGHLEIDLRQARFVEPYALVSIAAAAHAAANNGVPVIVHQPPDMSRANYLSRMRLPAAFDGLGILHGFDDVTEWEQADALLPLCTFENDRAAGELAGLVARRISENEETMGLLDRIYEVLVEICNNAAEHAGVDRAYVAAQVYDRGTPYQRIHVAIGDAGVGMAASLSGSYDVRDEMHGIELALTSEVTSSGTWGRGNGLPDACDLVTQVGGSVIVKSSGSRVRRGPAGPPDGQIVAVPGVVVGATIPCGVAAPQLKEASPW